MNNSNDSWSRCAKEFPISVINNNEIQLTKESKESIMRPVHVKKLEFNGLSSCKGIVATDIALANLEEIERYELVTKWIADGMFSSECSSYPSSPNLTNLVENIIEKLDEETLPRVVENLKKSPVLKCKRKSEKGDKKISPQGLNKSPIIGQRRRNLIDQKNRFGLWDKQFRNESCSSSRSEKSPILGKGLNSVRKGKAGIKRKRFMDRLDFGNDSISHLYSKDNGISSVLRSTDTEIEIREEKKQKIESLELSPEIFSEEIITASPRMGSMGSFRNQNQGILADKEKEKESEELFSSYKEDNEPLKTDDTKKQSDPDNSGEYNYWGNNKHCSSPVFGSRTKTKKKLFGLIKSEGNSFDSIIQGTEEFILPDVQEDLVSSYKENNEPLNTDNIKKELDLDNSGEYNYCGNNEYCLPPVIGSKIKTKRKLFGLNETEQKSFDSIIQDTEEFILPDIQKRFVQEELLKTDDIKKESGPDNSGKCNYWRNNEYCLPPVIGFGIKTKRKLFGLNKTKEKSFDSIIQDTEEFILPDIQERLLSDNNRSKRDDKLLILDSEFSIEKRKFVTDTERIDCDTSSENEGDKPDVKEGRINIITGVESDSDKTVSDIIEEPTTQDYLEPLNKTPIIPSQSGLASFCSRISIPVNSPKISETISPKDIISPHISIIDISVETTPPQTPESFAPPADLLDSGKKKKSRPKKGSLGARLQKLISGQVSCVRIWRHQMSRESALERSSAPCTTLLVVEGWMEYGKNLYRTKVLNDPYNLLKDCLDESVQSKERDENFSRNLVVMTNPDFVGSVKLLSGTVFKIYLPWEVFNRNSSSGNLVLHALYFNVVSNPDKMKLTSNDIEFQTEKQSKFIDNKIVREFDCPCLKNGKIDDTCLTKFTNHKIDIIAEIIK